MDYDGDGSDDASMYFLSGTDTQLSQADFLFL